MTTDLPDIYYFNPTCEYAVANGQTSWQPNRLLQKMEKDLGTLPLFLARPNDVVLLKKLPPGDFIERLETLGIKAPQFVLLNEISTNTRFVRQPKNRLLPWGWSPAAHRILEPLKTSCRGEFRESPVAQWKPGYRNLYSKKFALEILKSVLPFLPPEKVLPPNFIPEVCTTQKALETLIDRWGKLMVKAPWSSSGRGLQPVTKTPVVPKVWEKLLGIIREQGYAMAEPLLDKVADVAFEFEIKKGKIEFRGTSRFFTDEKGQYQGNFLNGWPAESTEDRFKKNGPAAFVFAESLQKLLVESLIHTIEASTLAQNYEGYFGVDTLIYRDGQGELRVNPCLEINVRQNMGLVSLQLEKLFVPGRKGIFKTFYQPGQSFFDFQQEMEKKYPLLLNGTHVKSGFLPLTPSDESTLFGAYIFAKH